ncbi:DUF3306 domain-containing protein [Rubrivivax sp. RP6-9]|uniref:DUF3306 domain-containing protein n=1 Tax=Rubrivivax sp. RP6-9 TaxID=3415750 RepID=UPI003CC65021
MAEDDGFLSRWSRRKVQVQRGLPPDAVAPTPTPAAAAVASPAAQPLPQEPPPEAAPDAPPAPPPLTLDDVAALTPDADFSRFVAPQVDGEVRNAALKKLFQDPHYNVMDGLDTYIDDYGKPDPIPASMLREMVQSKMLGLFREEEEAAAAAEAAAVAAASPPADPAPDTPALPPAATPSSLPEPTPDEDPALRLQPHDDAGRAGPEPRTGEDAGRQH